MANLPSQSRVAEAPVEPEKTTATQLPSWFLQNCVTKASEPKHDAAIRLVIRETSSSDGDDATTTKDATATAKDATNSPKVYEIESCTYQTLLDLALPEQNSQSGGQQSSWKFTHNAILLRVPGKNSKCDARHDFLKEATKRFARDKGADLVVLGIDDLRDLAEHFLLKNDSHVSEDCSSRLDQLKDHILGLSAWLVESVSTRWAGTTDSQTATENNTTEDDDVESDDDEMFTPVKDGREADKIDSLLLFREIFGIPAAKGAHDTTHRDTSPTMSQLETKQSPPLVPLVVLLSDIFDIFSMDASTKLFGHLEQVAEEARTLNRQVLVVGTIYHDPLRPGLTHHPMESQILHMLGCDTLDKSLRIFPSASPSQVSLFQEDADSSMGNISSNVRGLRRAIRPQLGEKDSALAQPYADWEVVSGSVLEQALGNKRLEPAEVASLARVIAADLTKENVAAVMERHFSGKKALERWLEQEDDEKDNPKSKLPARARPVVDRIMRDEERFEWELKLLDTIVDPSKQETQMLSAYLPTRYRCSTVQG